MFVPVCVALYVDAKVASVRTCLEGATRQVWSLVLDFIMSTVALALALALTLTVGLALSAALELSCVSLLSVSGAGASPRSAVAGAGV